MEQRKSSHWQKNSEHQAMAGRTRTRNSGVIGDKDRYLLEEYLGIALPKPLQLPRKRK